MVLQQVLDKKTTLRLLLVPEAQYLLRAELERKIRQLQSLQFPKDKEPNFYLKGKTLREVRDQKLYCVTHNTFKDYCNQVLCLGYRHVCRMIAAATAIDNIATRCPGELLPQSERQIRPLLSLSPQQQCSVWQEALFRADGQAPSYRIVEEIVNKHPRRNKLVRLGSAGYGAAPSTRDFE